MDFQYYLNKIGSMAVEYAPKVLLAVLALIVGLWAIKWIVNIISKALDKKEADVSLKKFLIGIAAILLKVLLILSVVSIVGVETTSFVAILAAAGFAIGMALQGSLSNFAGGVLILILKPYRVGDVISAKGFTGVVHEIQIFYTILKSFDNQTIIIPNGQVSNDAVTNINLEKQRRVDMVFGIGYDDDIKKAKDILLDLAQKDDRILKDPEMALFVDALADSSVNIALRVWCNNENYWGIYRDMQENVKMEFDKQGISIPYPQRDVHLFQESNN